MDLSAGPNILELYQKPVNITTYDTKWIPTSARFVVLGSYARATDASRSTRSTRRTKA